VEGEECPDCGGTGLYIRCKGECFVFKQLSKETATRHARPPRTWPPDTLQGLLSTNGPTAKSAPPPACLYKMEGVLPTINTH
ncbi:hypothetical protein ACJX0J_018761, partial [Zea mays]